MPAAVKKTKDELILEIKDKIVQIAGNDAGRPVNLHGVLINESGRSNCGGKISISCLFINEDGNGKSWFYEDGHAVRKRTVTSPNNSWNANEWAIVRNLNYKNMTPDMHAADVTWQGTVSTNWNSRGNNWSGLYGWVPDASYNVSIPNVANFPIVTEPSACHLLQIQSGSTLSVQSTGSLLIVGP